ncbi:MAG: type II secretion system F family protein [Planctomycetota bacterium]|nr:type II secretion system F family protein [Planctomycetota bacterium]
MLDALLTLTLAVLLAALVYFVRSGNDDDQGTRPSEGQVLARNRVLLSLAAVLAAAVAGLFGGLPTIIALAVSAFAGVGVHVALTTFAARRDLALELDLATALDLVVASLRAGAALVDSLNTASKESRGRTRVILEEICDRIRIGDAPSAVLFDIVDRYPQEGVRLFAFTLASHFNSGGSVAQSLREVSRTIRDRVDVIRRSSSQAVETQASVAGILAITYGLAFLMWRQYPERVDSFLSNDIGLSAVGISVFLQAIGVAWISRTTQVEV